MLQLLSRSAKGGGRCHHEAQHLQQSDAEDFQDALEDEQTDSGTEAGAAFYTKKQADSDRIGAGEGTPAVEAVADAGVALPSCEGGERGRTEAQHLHL